ncbi:OLC1v1031073C1 [Oldenlandia corymbosa var. corymbosa]|uniref:OLC1v1031073C1 n=1 Tax=Oldenlandia corymbosa var. corymbosa TaxID=529605 RepID=A0AAV1CHQ7_OLDCO|nr:OLC1v1031073C1 [Oldenlandia corymbosa var. corymbosa]
MLSSNARSQLYGDEDPFPVVNSEEEMSTSLAAETKKKKKRLVKGSEKEPRKKAKADVLVTKSAVEEGKIVPPVTEKPNVPPMESGPSNKSPAKDKGKGPLKEEEIILPSHLFVGGPTVAVHAFGDPPKGECPLLEEFAAQLTKSDSVRLCAAFLFRMLSTGGMVVVIDEMNMAITEYGGHGVAVASLKRLKTTFVGVSLWGPGQDEHSCWELSILDVPDEYIGVELEDEDDVASEERDIGTSGSKDKDPPAEGNSHEVENTQLRQNQQITISPSFLKKHHVLARVQHIISIRTHRFISAMDMLKGRTREIELLMEYINEIQNLLLDHNIGFQSFEKPEEVADPRTKSSREEFFLRIHAQDEEIVDLKDKLNQCVNLLSQHGFRGIIHPSPDNPSREVLVIV